MEMKRHSELKKGWEIRAHQNRLSPSEHDKVHERTPNGEEPHAH